MDIKALQLCSHFAYQPNSLGYCGRKTARAIFRNCIVNKRCDKVEDEIKNFLVLNPYIQTIAQVTRKHPLSYEVIEAYWLGNDLLKHIKPEHYTVLLKNLAAQGVPKILLQEIEKKVPKKFVPIHLFNILHIGVGKATMSVPFNLKSVNNCMIRWGKVSKVYAHIIEVNLMSLSDDYIFQVRRVNQRYDPMLSGKILSGDVVFAHWGSIVKKTTRREIKNVAFWTEKLLNSLS